MKPADDDVLIYELCDKGSYIVTRWHLFGGSGFPPQYCRTKKEAEQAKTEAISHARIKRIDIWIGGDDEDPPFRWKTFRPQK